MSTFEQLSQPLLAQEETVIAESTIEDVEEENARSAVSDIGSTSLSTAWGLVSRRKEKDLQYFFLKTINGRLEWNSPHGSRAPFAEMCGVHLVSTIKIKYFFSFFIFFPNTFNVTMFKKKSVNSNLQVMMMKGQHYTNFSRLTNS